MPAIAPDIAVLVEDDYQRQGIGSAMLHLLTNHADRHGIGIGALQATVLTEQKWTLPLLRRYDHCSAAVRIGALEVTLLRQNGCPARIG